ncbi:hypothetical protein AKJ16_DCAP07065, partial [Drosera capensis]
MKVATPRLKFETEHLQQPADRGVANSLANPRNLREMANPTETSMPSEPLDTLTLRSRIAELSSILKHAVIPLEASASSPEMLLRDCVKSLQEKVWEVVSDGGKFACFVGETL